MVVGPPNNSNLGTALKSCRGFWLLNQSRYTLDLLNEVLNIDFGHGLQKFQRSKLVDSRDLYKETGMKNISKRKKGMSKLL